MRRTNIWEGARRYRAVASLFRQATYRPVQSAVTPNPAEEWDQIALAQLESYFWRSERREPAW
jgi:hypothetical protein